MRTLHRRIARVKFPFSPCFSTFSPHDIAPRFQDRYDIYYNLYPCDVTRYDEQEYLYRCDISIGVEIFMFPFFNYSALHVESCKCSIVNGMVSGT